MGLKLDYQTHILTLNKDFVVGDNHLMDDLPNKFNTPDFLFFFMMKDYFWADIEDSDKRLTVSTAMTELYISVLTHVYSSTFSFNEGNHELEHSILYGDMLSGAFSEKLIKIDAIGLQKKWLKLLKTIHGQLVHMSLINTAIQDKKNYVIKAIVEDTINAESDYFVKLVQTFFNERVLTDNEGYIQPDIIIFVKEMLNKDMKSRADLETIIGE